MQALEILAKNVGMDMPTMVSGENVEKKKREKEQVLKALSLAEMHYKDNLYLKTSLQPQNYVKTRGFTRRELDSFNIGYSKDYNDIVNFLHSNNISYETMRQAGLVEKNDNGNYFDLFANRLMFPIKNIHDECIGFSGRILDKKKVLQNIKTAQIQ